LGGLLHPARRAQRIRLAQLHDRRLGELQGVRHHAAHHHLLAAAAPDDAAFPRRPGRPAGSVSGGLYTPFEAPYRMSMGLLALPVDEWVEIDETFEPSCA